MYHCHLYFYLTGSPCRAFSLIEEVPPLHNFTYEFATGDAPEEAAKADVIIANLSGQDAGTALCRLLKAKKRDAEVIVLADGEQRLALAESGLLTEHGEEIADIWTLPMPEEEILFRFGNWQRLCAMKKDYWQTDQYLEATINSIPNLIWYKTKDGIHEKVNDSFCRTVNKTKEDAEGKDHYYIWDVDPREAGADCMESDLEVMDKKETCISEETVESADGIKLLTTYKSPLYDLDGSVMGTVGIGIDVTQERAYEQALITKNRALETIFTTLECGVLCHTLDGSRVLNVNDAALKILGYESLEEMERGFDLIVPAVMEEDQPKLKALFKTLKKKGDSFSTEYRVQHKDGEIVHVMGNVKLIEENGQLLYQRFLLDVTEQKLQEKQNERRQMEMMQALSTDYNVVCLFDLDTGRGIPLRVSSECAHIFVVGSAGEISLSGCMEHYIGERVYEADREMMQQAVAKEGLREELTQRKIYYVNYRLSADGEIRYYEMKIARTGEWGEHHNVVLGLRSVDEEIRNELEQKKLLEDALLQANNASRAKSEFLSNMSHDIRTPMNAIVGFTALALTHIDSKSEVEGYLGKIRASGDHLLNLINDVLDMNRIESGKMKLEEAPCSLLEIIKELHGIMQADTMEKGLEFFVDTEHVSDQWIYCDKLRLNQILLNVVSNAVKYTNTGGSVSLTVTEKASGMEGYAGYELCVSDTGIGMSEEFISHVFDPFERENNTTISGIQGTGLGMAITKNMVDMMKGSIEVKSRQGAGTQVTLSFMFRIVPDEKDAGAHHRDGAPKGGRGTASRAGKKAVRHKGGCILLTEDNELNQEIAVAILEDAGFSVEVADNGRIAVDMLQSAGAGYYELVLMDVQMPVMNGYEAARQIRALKDKKLASIPILAMTANAFEEDRQEAIRSGMNGHIAKPIDVKKLFDAMSEFLS